MAERFKAPAWKACSLVIVSGVRIPFSPPHINSNNFLLIHNSTIKPKSNNYYTSYQLIAINRGSYSLNFKKNRHSERSERVQKDIINFLYILDIYMQSNRLQKFYSFKRLDCFTSLAMTKESSTPNK